MYRDLPKFRTLDALELWEVFIAMYFPTLELVIAGDSNTHKTKYDRMDLTEHARDATQTSWGYPGISYSEDDVPTRNLRASAD